MTDPRAIGALWVLLAALLVFGLPRPDDDQLSVRDPDGFGDWWKEPADLGPLYETLSESTAGPRRTWTVAESSTVALEFGGSDGGTYSLPLTVVGDVVVDTRNLDLSRGTLSVSAPDLGVELPAIHVDVIGSSHGTAPRSVGAAAIGAGRLRIRAAEAVELEGRFEITREAPDRFVVTVHESPSIDLPALGLHAAVGPLGRRFGVEWVEPQASLQLRVELTAK